MFYAIFSLTMSVLNTIALCSKIRQQYEVIYSFSCNQDYKYNSIKCKINSNYKITFIKLNLCKADSKAIRTISFIQNFESGK